MPDAPGNNSFWTVQTKACHYGRLSPPWVPTSAGDRFCAHWQLYAAKGWQELPAGDRRHDGTAYAPSEPAVSMGSNGGTIGVSLGSYWGLILATLQPFKALETLFQATFPENSGQFAITADSGQGTRIPQPTRKAPAQLRRVTT